MQSLRNGNSKMHPIPFRLQLRMHRSISSNKNRMQLRLLIPSLKHKMTCPHGNLITRFDRPLGRHRQARESCDRNLRITSRTRRDEPMRHRVHFVRRQRVLLCLRERTLAEIGAQVRTVARFDGEDAAGSSQVAFVGDLLCSTEVGGRSDAFEDAGGCDEGFDARDAEGVGAFLNGLDAGSFETGGEEVDMRGFVSTDCLQVLVEGAVVAGGFEVGFGEVGESLTVEFVFEVFEGQGVAEDVNCQAS